MTTVSCFTRGLPAELACRADRVIAYHMSFCLVVIDEAHCVVEGCVPSTSSASVQLFSDACSAQSRCVSCPDEVVFYSGACGTPHLAVCSDVLVGSGAAAPPGRPLWNGSPFCAECECSVFGAASTHVVGQVCFPVQYSVCLSPSALSRTVAQATDDLSGDWNIQADASLTHLVDFSHFYVLVPDSRCHWAFSLTQHAVCCRSAAVAFAWRVANVRARRRHGACPRSTISGRV